MKNCRNIRGDLSAYIDDELASARRAQIASHLETCAGCQQELLELKKVTAGVAALPRLQPAPRFLRDVRRKIAEGEDPEATTWLDHVFQPFWLKVPLEIAALVLIVGLVIRGEHPATPQPVGNRELVSAADGDTDNNRADTASQNADARSVAEELRPLAAQETPALAEAKKKSSEPLAAQENEQKSAPATESRAVSSADNQPQSTASSAAVDEGNFSGGGQQATSRPRSVATASAQSSYAVAAPNSPAMGLIEAFQPARPKPREQVTLQSRDFASVHDRSQQLAARCNGKVLVGLPSTDGKEQVLFVEVPREYAAAFKVELSRTSSNALPQGSTADGLDATNFAAISPGGGMGGVLTGTASTNAVIGNATSSVSGNQEAPAPTVILEIHVVAPTN